MFNSNKKSSDQETIEKFAEEYTEEKEPAYASWYSFNKIAQTKSDIFFLGHDTRDKNSFVFDYLTSDFNYAAENGRYVYKILVNLERPWVYSEQESPNDWIDFYQDLETEGYDGILINEEDGSQVVVPFAGASVEILEVINNLPEAAKV